MEKNAYEKAIVNSLLFLSFSRSRGVTLNQSTHSNVCKYFFFIIVSLSRKLNRLYPLRSVRHTTHKISYCSELRIQVQHSVAVIRVVSSVHLLSAAQKRKRKKKNRCDVYIFYMRQLLDALLIYAYIYIYIYNVFLIVFHDFWECITRVVNCIHIVSVGSNCNDIHTFICIPIIPTYSPCTSV